MESKRLVRTAGFDFDLQRSADAGVAVLSGKLAVFNDWTEIKSPVERPNHFMERIASGAFTKTIQENGQRLKVLFQHGRDASIGHKPLGRILRLEETNEGVEYEVELLDAPYVHDLIPGLEAGLYGSSFIADDIHSDLQTRVERSSYNPRRIPEVTRRELRMHEFGPVTFPSYATATAKMRSQTEDFLLPGLQELVALIRDTDLEATSALTTEEEPEEKSTPERTVSRSEAVSEPEQEEKPSWWMEY